MDHFLTPEQIAWREEVEAFAERRLSHAIADRDAARRFPTSDWRACAELGIQGLLIPDELGGRGRDAVFFLVAMEALGRVYSDAGMLFALGAQALSVQIPLRDFGTVGQKRAYLPGLCDGSLMGAHAMTEAGSGSDAFRLETRAERTAGGYRITGSKTYITNAPAADLLLLFAATDPSAGFLGLSCFVVRSDHPGVTITPPLPKMGLHTVPMAEVRLDSCEVGEEALVGAEGAGARIFQASMEWERGLILAPQVGIQQRVLDECVAFARARRRFGKPLGQFQAVSHRLAEMKVRLEASRLLMYQFADKKARGLRAGTEASLAKLYVSEACVQSSLDAIQTFGGAGYLVETGLERVLRDTIAGRIYSGTSEMQKGIIAKALGL